MAEKENQKQEKKAEKAEKAEKQEAKKRPAEEENTETLVRIMGFDIPGSKSISTGLTRIKGISWAVSNFVCLKNGYKDKKIADLSKAEIVKLEEFLKNINLPDFMKNRRSDPETGKVLHLYGTDLDITKDFDIKRMKKMKSYKGIRHSSKLPVRGQRTRSHFRAGGRATGLGLSKKPAPVAGAKPAEAKK